MPGNRCSGIGQEEEEEQEEAPECEVGVAVEDKPGCVVAALHRAKGLCLGISHSSSRCGSSRDGCVACTHLNDGRGCRILGRRFWGTEYGSIA